MPVDVPPATRILLALSDGGVQDRRLLRPYDAGGDIVIEREHGDRRLADGKGRRIDDGRQQTLEALACLGQLRRNARCAGMNLGADMVRDNPNDPFAILRRKPCARILKPRRQPIEPEPAVWIEHDFDDALIIEPCRDLHAQRRAQHPRAA